MNPLKSLPGTLISGLVVSLLIAALVDVGPGNVAKSLFLWIHIWAGITWIGLLYYFNFVQVQALAAAAADEGGPGGAGISKYVAPRALLWFRWAALATWLAGALLLLHQGDFLSAFTLGAVEGSSPGVYGMRIGIGAWLGTIMLFNVWVLIWPNQKKVLGMVEATADEIAKAKNTALLASRTNTLLSIPMLMSMVGAQNGFVF